MQRFVSWSCISASLVMAAHASAAQPEEPDALPQLPPPQPPPPPPAPVEARPPSATTPEPPPAEAPPAASAAQTSEWYGWETLIVDGFATGLIVAGLAQKKDPLGIDNLNNAWFNKTTYGLRALGAAFGDPLPAPVALVEIGLGLYTFGPPLVHAANARPAPAIKSLGVRLAGPSAGLLAGVSIGAVAGLATYIVANLADPEGNNGPRAVVVLVSAIEGGALAGYVAPILVDAIALSRVRVPAAPPGTRRAGAGGPEHAWLSVIPRISVRAGGASLSFSGEF